MDVLLIITAVLCLIMLIAAVVAVYTGSLVGAVLSAGAVSLTASVVYVLLAAPDVAMTEAAIGSGLSTVIFFYVLTRIRRNENG